MWTKYNIWYCEKPMFLYVVLSLILIFFWKVIVLINSFIIFYFITMQQGSILEFNDGENCLMLKYITKFSSYTIFLSGTFYGYFVNYYVDYNYYIITRGSEHLLAKPRVLRCNSLLRDPNSLASLCVNSSQNECTINHYNIWNLI